MPSKRQLAANRRNAQHSTGPRTPQGRRAVALNALKHGLRSQLTVIPGENEADFHALFGEFIEDAAPRSARDLVAIRQAAQSEWRLRRIAAIEGAMYRNSLKNPPPVQNPGPDEIGSIINRLMAQQPASEPAQPESPEDLIATRFSSGEVNRFATLARYEAVLMRQYRQAWADLDARPYREEAEPAAEECDSPAPEPAAETHVSPDPAPEPEPHYTQPSPDALAWKSALDQYGQACHLRSETPATPSGDTEPASQVPTAVPAPAETPINTASPQPSPESCQSKPFPESDSTGLPCIPPRDPFPASNSVHDITAWVEKRAKQLEPFHLLDDDEDSGDDDLDALLDSAA